MKPVLDLFFASERNEIYSPEVIFLNLVQALETFHARFIADTKALYRKHIDEVLAPFQDANVKRTWWDFLFGKKQEARKDILLSCRIADLVFANGEICYWQYWGGNQFQFVDRIVSTRNYFTHYNEKKKDSIFSNEELPFINEHLSCLLKYHILLRLGYDAQKAKKKLQEKRADTNTAYSIVYGLNGKKKK